MKMLNLETSYPSHISRIDEDRRVEINFDPKAPATRFYVCTFEPGKGEYRKGCWTLREAVDLAGKEVDRIRPDEEAALPPTAPARP